MYARVGVRQHGLVLQPMCMPDRQTRSCGLCPGMQVAIELFYNAISLVVGTVLIKSGRMSPVRHPDTPKLRAAHAAAGCASCYVRPDSDMVPAS